MKGEEEGDREWNSFRWVQQDTSQKLKQSEKMRESEMQKRMAMSNVMANQEKNNREFSQIV